MGRVEGANDDGEAMTAVVGCMGTVGQSYGAPEPAALGLLRRPFSLAAVVECGRSEPH